MLNYNLLYKESKDLILMIKELLKRDVVKQFLRFLLIGLESTVLNYLFFLILLYFLMVNYVASYAIGFVVGTLFGFVFNKLWTFESEREAHKEIGIYFLVYLISLGIGAVLIRFIVNHFNLIPAIANIPVLVVTTIINFLGTKVLAFRNKKW